MGAASTKRFVLLLDRSTIERSARRVAIPQFVTAEELSESVKKYGVEIGARRLTDLAECGQIPHSRCDGGPPVFRKSVAQDWIAENLIADYAGQGYPISLSVIDPRSLGGYVSGVPASLVGMADWLREFPLGLLREAMCIYFLIKDNNIVYVGKSEILAGRLMAHFKDKVFDRALFFRVPRGEAPTIELAFIKLLKPPYNSAKEKAPIESRTAAYNTYTSRYMRAIGFDGEDPIDADIAKLVAMIDRFDHDHEIVVDEVNDRHRDNMSLRGLLRRVLDRMVDGEAFDRSNFEDAKLAYQIKKGIERCRSSEDYDPEALLDRLAADKEPAP